MTAALVAVLAGARMLEGSSEQDEFFLQEVSPIEMSSPEDPPDLDEPEPEPEPEEVVEEVPPPVTALVLDVSLPNAPSINASQIVLSPDQSLAVMTQSQAPSKLPSKPAIKPRNTTAKPKKPTKPRKPRTQRPPKPPIKSVYNASELDSRPRELRVGRFTWPSRAKGKSGTVRFLLEINTSGRVTVKRTLSCSDVALVSAARKVATGSRFTVPKKNGRPVRALFTKTYQLKKPRR